MFETLKYDLKHNRRNAMRNITAWAIFGAIILVFVFWGMNPRSQGVATGGAAATVNDATISMAQMMDMMERLRRDPRYEQLQSLGGDAARQFLQSQALGQLVEIELARQGTEKERIWTSDEEVRDVITGVPFFQENGLFKRELYLSYLTNSRKTPSEFEDEIRRGQSISRAERVFAAAMKPLPLETEKEKALKSMKANLEFASFMTESVVIPETLPQAEVKTFAAQAGNDAKIKSYFDSHKQDFSSPEKVKARHILIRAKAGDSAAEQKALAKIQDLEKRAKGPKGEDFAKLANQNSEDPGSKSKGGLLDFFSRGRMVPEFENAAFQMKPGEVSAPVKTEYGYHLIQLLEKKPALNRNLEDVREEIAAVLIAKEKSRVDVEALQEALKKGDQAAVSAFVTSHKLKWEETGPFAVNADSVPKIGANDEALQTAFQLNAEKPLAKQLIREGGRAFIVKYKPAGEKSAEKSDDSSIAMTELMASRRGEESLRKWLDAMRKSSRISTNAQVGREAAND